MTIKISIKRSTRSKQSKEFVSVYVYHKGTKDEFRLSEYLTNDEKKSLEFDDVYSDFFDSTEQCFIAKHKCDKASTKSANKVLTTIKEEIQVLFDNGTSIRCIKDELKKRVTKKSDITLLEQADKVVQAKKNEFTGHSTYKIYRTVRNIIAKNKQCANYVLANIDQKAFDNLAKNVLNTDKQYGNYIEHFKHIVNQYCDDNDIPQLKKPYLKKSERENKKSRRCNSTQKDCFSITEFDMFRNYTPKVTHHRKHDRLYHDICLLMYYLYSRPIDILRMRIEDIKTDVKGEMYWKCKCFKKENENVRREDNKYAYAPITEQAQKIINDYITDPETGIKRTNGYVFPLTKINDYNNSDSFTSTKTNITKYVKLVCTELGISKPNEKSLYTFRHSAFTHSLKNVNLYILAIWGGTSVKVLEDTYLHKKQIVSNGQFICNCNNL